MNDETTESLIAKRHAAGKPPAEDVAADAQYWEQHRKFEAMKDQPKKAA
jgi:hypothetical protein